MYGTILVGSDGSDGSRAALAHAVELAAATGALVHVATVVDDSANPLRFGVQDVEALDDAAQKLLEEVTAVHDGRDVEFDLEVLRGNPAKALVGHAADIDADAIVVGAAGFDGVAERILGSTADRVARLSDRPVVIVPTER